MAVEPVVDAISYVGWAILMGFFAYATSIRYSIRLKYDIYGNSVEDFFAVMVLYPFAAYQMEHHMDHAYDLDRTDYPMVEKPDKPNGYRASGAYGYREETPANDKAYHMDHAIKRPGKEHSQSDGNWTPSMSHLGSHTNPATDDDLSMRSGNSNWSKTNVV